MKDRDYQNGNYLLAYPRETGLHDMCGVTGGKITLSRTWDALLARSPVPRHLLSKEQMEFLR